MNDGTLSDEELVALFRGPSGDGPSAQEADSAWSSFLEKFEPRLRSTCRFWMSRYGRPDEAEDRFQDVVALLCRDNYRPIREFAVGRARMSTWLTTIATNSCRGWFRSRDRTVFAPERDGEGGERTKELPDPGGDPLTELSDDEEGRRMIGALSKCIAGLEEKRRLVLVTRLLCQLAFERNVTMSEVGRIHGDSPQKTKYRLDTALESLRDCVEQDLAEEETP